jgi:hypothetical protein
MPLRPGRATGPEIEPLPSYQPQTTCDPTPKPGAVALLDLLLRAYPGTRNLGIIRECHVGGTSEHKEGRALDWGVSALDPAEKAKADELIAQLLATDVHGNVAALARRLGVMYLIWDQRIWTPKGGWQPYSGSSPHTDHVHISLTREGAQKLTSYWTGVVAHPSSGPWTPPVPAPSPRKPLPWWVTGLGVGAIVWGAYRYARR